MISAVNVVVAVCDGDLKEPKAREPRHRKSLAPGASLPRVLALQRNGDGGFSGERLPRFRHD